MNLQLLLLFLHSSSFSCSHKYAPSLWRWAADPLSPAQRNLPQEQGGKHWSSSSDEVVFNPLTDSSEYLQSARLSVLRSTVVSWSYYNITYNTCSRCLLSCNTVYDVCLSVSVSVLSQAWWKRLCDVFMKLWAVMSSRKLHVCLPVHSGVHWGLCTVPDSAERKKETWVKHLL